ncbi:MAG TPA: hypothetical protein DD458_06040, partial [Prolixibacteraceae bacterium]|nr:hypothetical protein [Prolixibacteraceae bacterium]HCU61017.1 hypothetical protein [Prolixibacteraceae bacterium]
LLYIYLVLFMLSGLESKSVTNDKSSFKYALVVEEKDPNLNIEKWMIDGNFWDSLNNNPLPVIEDNDGELELEAWMIQGKYWK